MRVCLFTDTFADVNGVSRFIQNLAQQARESGRDLVVVTSTRRKVLEAPNVINVPPSWSRPMPAYPQLDLAVPPARALRRLATDLRPDAVHISTPGPVGFFGRGAARRMGVPVLGTYHTDFPAYIDHLFDDRCLTWATARYMRWFYAPFARVFLRSGAHAAALERLGIPAERLVRLSPGIDTSLFCRARRDDAIWDGLGVPRAAVKVLSVGRVSVEKNLPLLARAWPPARRALEAEGIDARLIVIGDGPYRAEMEAKLAGTGAHFLGFRHGTELATLYASGDLFVFPSATDTLGQVAMEAQACGLAVLVSDVGGPREMVEPGVTGLVLPADRAGAWTEAIIALARDPERRARMGEAACRAMSARSFGASFEHFWSVHEEAVVTRGTAGRPAGRGPSAP